MAKKSQSVKQKRNTKKRRLNPVAVRQLAVLVVILLGAGGAILFSALRAHPFADARKVSDEFMQALSACDTEGIKRTAPIIGLNDERMQQFRDSCNEGAITYTFDQESGAVDKVEKGEHLKNVGYIYDLHIPNQYNGKFLVWMEWIGDENKWQVFTAEATTLGGFTNTQQQ